MLNKIRYIFQGLFIVTLLMSSVVAEDAADGDKLKVGVTGSAPFVIVEGKNEGVGISGFSVDVWEQMALKAGIGFDYQVISSVKDGFAQLEAGEVDVLVGPISITAERQEKFEFTQPYFNSSLGIVSKDVGLTVWERVKPFFSKTFFIALGIFLVILGIVGLLVWAVERRACDGPFSEGLVKGLGNGIWLALVTMTTVGYGDIAPRTVPGRIVLGGWMIVALVSATSLLAGLAGTIALSSGDGVRIETAGDLDGQRVAVVRDSPSVDFVTKHEAQKVHTESLADSMNLFKEDKVKAVVFDRPQMRYYLENNPIEDALISPNKYRKQGYGFAFRKNDPRAENYNLILLTIREAAAISEIESDWLPRNSE